MKIDTKEPPKVFTPVTLVLETVEDCAIVHALIGPATCNGVVRGAHSHWPTLSKDKLAEAYSGENDTVYGVYQQLATIIEEHV